MPVPPSVRITRTATRLLGIIRIRVAQSGRLVVPVEPGQLVVPSSLLANNVATVAAVSPGLILIVTPSIATIWRGVVVGTVAVESPRASQ